MFFTVGKYDARAPAIRCRIERVVVFSHRMYFSAIYHLRRYWQGHPSERDKVRQSVSLGKIVPIISHNLETVQDRN